MPSNEIKINGSPELTWSVGDRQMPELFQALMRLGRPSTEAARKLQYEDNKGRLYEVLLTEEEWPTFGERKVCPVMALRDAYGMTFYVIEDDHCYVVLKDQVGGQGFAKWLPGDVSRALAKLHLQETSTLI